LNRMNHAGNNWNVAAMGGAVVTTTMNEKYHRKVIQVLALKQENAKLREQIALLEKQLARIHGQIEKWSKSR